MENIIKERLMKFIPRKAHKKSRRRTLKITREKREMEPVRIFALESFSEHESDHEARSEN